MKTPLIFILLTLAFTTTVFSQGVIINPDGSHSVVIGNGTTSTIINPDGSHSVVFDHGGTATIVNSDGSHSIAIKNDATTTVINSDGSHSIGINHGGITTVVHADGSHSAGINQFDDDNEAPLNALYVDTDKQMALKEAAYENQLIQENALFQIPSTSYKDERVKLRILRRRGLINRHEFKSLRQQNVAYNTQDGINKANQLFKLNEDLENEVISFDQFQSAKKGLIVSGY